jgi:hypothetical protein
MSFKGPSIFHRVNQAHNEALTLGNCGNKSESFLLQVEIQMGEQAVCALTVPG